MVKTNRARFVYYCLMANFWMCPAVQAQHVHKKESLRDQLLQQRERYRRAPPDYGFGENVPPPADLTWNHQQSGATPAAPSGATAVPPSTAALPVDAAAVPKGGPDAATHGMFGPVLPWPFILIHMGLLPDGRVMNYGSTDPETDQIYYDVWDPRRGGGGDSHLLLPNQTKTNIFCSGLGLLPDGRLLLTGGDTTIGDASPVTNPVYWTGTLSGVVGRNESSRRANRGSEWTRITSKYLLAMRQARSSWRVW